MKAVSLKQPFAGFIWQGIKPLESRTYGTQHRGDLLICVSQKFHEGMCLLDGVDLECRSLIHQWVVTGNPPLHLGKAICVAELYFCRPMTVKDEKDACCRIYPEAKVWGLRNIRHIIPFDVRGALSLFEVDDRLIKYTGEELLVPEVKPVLVQTSQAGTSLG